jgi:hypothetical protein
VAVEFLSVAAGQQMLGFRKQYNGAGGSGAIRKA